MLVVEDETMVALLIDDMLQDIGCEVVGITGQAAESPAIIDGQPIWQFSM